MSGEIIVSAEVKAGVDAVRESGAVNMFDYPQVMILADQMGYLETAAWMSHNKSLYAEGIFKGFKADDETG